MADYPTQDELRAMNQAAIDSWLTLMRFAQPRLEGDPLSFETFAGAPACRNAALPSDDFSNVIMISDSAQASGLADAAAFFREIGAKGHVWAADWAMNEAMGAALAAEGFTLIASGTGLCAHPEAVAEAQTQLDVRPAQSDDERNDFLSVNAAGWDVGEELMPYLKACVDPCFDDPDWRVLLAYDGQTPAGTAMLSLHGDIAYFADAATHPDHRRKGAQRALIAERARLAAERNARYVHVFVESASQSHRNQLAMGLRVSFGQTEWRLKPA